MSEAFYCSTEPELFIETRSYVKVFKMGIKMKNPKGIFEEASSLISSGLSKSDLRLKLRGLVLYGWMDHVRDDPFIGLSADPDLKSVYVEINLNKKWNWGSCGLSSNPCITPDFVERHINRNWDWGHLGLSSNPSITPAFIERHLHRDWDWSHLGLSSNPAMTPEFIDRHMDRGWDWSHMGLGSNLSIPAVFVRTKLKSGLGCQVWRKDTSTINSFLYEHC